MERKISIQNIDITRLHSDAIVNAANEGLWAGGGVCGAIFENAGSDKLSAACAAIGGCKTGNAVITPGFNLPAKYIIHAVGPVWHGGEQDEPKLLYSAYKQSLRVAKENDCHSIGFPLISAGIYGYPIDKAWRKAIQACQNFLKENPDYEINIVFAVLDEGIQKIGEDTIAELGAADPQSSEAKIVTNRGMIHWFARTWSYMFRDHERLPFYYFEEGRFIGEGLRELGFEMDSGQSFCEIFGVNVVPAEPEDLKNFLNDSRMTVWLLGTLIFSYWRYWNHWANAPMEDKDFEWFAVAFDRLAEMTDQAALS